MKKRIILLIILLFIPLNIKATKQEDVGKRIAAVALSAATTHVGDFTYTYFWDGTPSNPISRKSVTNGYLNNGYQGIKSSGYTYGFKNRPGINSSFTNKFAMYCETWALLIPYHAKGGGSTTDPYQKIPLNTANLRPGDKVRYTYPDSHIAIYVDDNNDSDPDTYRIAEAAGYNGGIRVSVARFSGKGETGKVTEMQRIPEEIANQVSYGVINASTDWHDSLDHFKPTLTSVSQKDNFGTIVISGNDYKRYNGTVQSREVEPANNGIAAYAITTSSSEPTTGWIKVSAREVANIEARVPANGTYYAWIMDVGGNVDSQIFTVKNLDSSGPSIGSALFSTTSSSIRIIVDGVSDPSGIREYKYYLNDALYKTTATNAYTFTTLLSNTTYHIKYSVTDKAGNTSSSQTYDVATYQYIQGLSLDKTVLDLNVGATYTLKAVVTPNNTMLTWVSNNEKVAKVVNGTITAIGEGTATIAVSAGGKIAKCIVTVEKKDLAFATSGLPSTKVGNNYSYQIETNTNATIELVSGSLPPGLSIDSNGLITGATTVTGKYKFTVLANYNNENIDKEYEIIVDGGSSFSLWGIIIPLALIGGAIWYFYNIKDRNKF